MSGTMATQTDPRAPYATGTSAGVDAQKGSTTTGPAKYQTRAISDPEGHRGGARNAGPDARAPLRNPNTSYQPLVGVSTTPTYDRMLQLQVEQRFAHQALTRTMGALRSTLEDSDDPDADAVAGELDATIELLSAGGDLAAMEQGLTDYESTLAMITPLLSGADLAAMNGALTSMDYIYHWMRADDVLPALPEVEAAGEGEGEEVPPPEPTPTPTPTPAPTQQPTRAGF